MQGSKDFETAQAAETFEELRTRLNKAIETVWRVGNDSDRLRLSRSADYLGLLASDVVLIHKLSGVKVGQRIPNALWAGPRGSPAKVRRRMPSGLLEVR